mmetsp:Transcript_78352/g.254573  ORF Transcript_78352/g.254573 Transcript_78352/m.254573 type:complete len:680 (+) Transcript_78352:80-2119(+)
MPQVIFSDETADDDEGANSRVPESSTKSVKATSIISDAVVCSSAVAQSSQIDHRAHEASSVRSPSATTTKGQHGGPTNKSAFLSLETQGGPMDGERFGVRRRIRLVLDNSWTEGFIATVVFVNFFLIVLETDSRATYPGQSEGHDPAMWVLVSGHACYTLFVVELVLRFTMDRGAFFESNWNRMDLFVVTVGAIEYLLMLSGQQIKGINLINVVRLCRMIRLLRVMRLFKFLKEFRRLLQMMGSCFKTLFWSLLLLILVMMIWAVVAVEMLNPLVQEVAEERLAWADCDRCARSFSSVWQACITLFQTIVAGDSWGYMAIPVIEKYPWTGIIFAGALLTLVFGILNLIVAVIVDTFAENREKDVITRAADMDEEEREQKLWLAKIFDKIDEDKSGAVSFGEITEGAKKVAEFRHWLRVMDIDATGLEQLFNIVDEDGSGEIDPSEFVEAMYRMKNADAKTATTFVKHMVTRMDQEQQKMKVHLAGLERHDPGEAAWDRTEEAILFRLNAQEAAIQRAVEVAITKASEVAMEAALKAAAATTQDVMAKVRSSSRQLASEYRVRASSRSVSSTMLAAGIAGPTSAGGCWTPFGAAERTRSSRSSQHSVSEQSFASPAPWAPPNSQEPQGSTGTENLDNSADPPDVFTFADTHPVEALQKRAVLYTLAEGVALNSELTGDWC